MNIELKTTTEIKAHAEKVKALFQSTGKQLYADIFAACQAELNRRGQTKAEELPPYAQKKSRESSINQGQLQRTPIRDAAAKVPQEIKDEVQDWAEQVERDAKNEHYDQSESERALNIKENRVLVGRAAEITVTIPVAEVKVGDTVRELTQTEITSLLKTYFKGVATGRAMERGNYTEAYASEMGKAVWRLFDGWNLIYKQTQEGTAWPPLEDIFPGFSRASQPHKVCADVLWRWASNRKE